MEVVLVLSGDQSGLEHEESEGSSPCSLLGPVLIRTHEVSLKEVVLVLSRDQSGLGHEVGV